MRVICITGPIASGKTEVVSILQQRFSLPTIKMDYVGHFLLHKEYVIRQVRLLLGEDVIVDGRISRRKVAKKVFSDATLLERYNKFIHPLMLHEASKLIYHFQALGYNTILLEAAILFEAGWVGLCSEVWSVISPPKYILGRLGLEKFYRFYIPRRKHQQPDIFYKENADIVICNNGGIDKLRVDVINAFLWQKK